MQLPDGSRVSSANQSQQLCKIMRFMGHERCAILRAKVYKPSPRLLSRFLQHRMHEMNEAGVVGLGAQLEFFSHISTGRPKSM